MPRGFLSAFRSPLSGMFRAVGNSSWSVIARPTRRAAPFKPPTSRAATDQLTSRFSPDNLLDRYSRLLRNDFEVLASFADDYRDSRRLRYHCGTRVCSMTLPDRCATHVSDKGKSESCLVKALAEHTGESVRAVSELCSCWETINTPHVNHGSGE